MQRFGWCKYVEFTDYLLALRYLSTSSVSYLLVISTCVLNTVSYSASAGDSAASCLGQSCVVGVTNAGCCTNTICSLANGSDISTGTKCCLPGGSSGSCNSAADCCQGADCVNNLCVTQIGTTCTTDCDNDLGLVCVGGHCLLKYEQACQNNTDCLSGVCHTQTVTVNQAVGSQPASTTITYQSCGCASSNDCPNHANICNPATNNCTCLGQAASCVTGAAMGNTSCCNGNCYANLSTPNAPPNINGFCPACPSSCTQPSDCDQSNGCDQGWACTYPPQTATTVGSGAQSSTTYSPTSGTCATCIGNQGACVAYYYQVPVACTAGLVTSDCGSGYQCVNNVCTASDGTQLMSWQSADNCCLGYSCNDSNLCVPDQSPAPAASSLGGRLLGGSSSSDTGAIIGGVVGGIALGAAAAGAYWWYNRRKRGGAALATKVTKTDRVVIAQDPNLSATRAIAEVQEVVQALLDPAATSLLARSPLQAIPATPGAEGMETTYLLHNRPLQSAAAKTLAQQVLEMGVRSAAQWFQQRANSSSAVYIDANGQVHTNVNPVDSALITATQFDGTAEGKPATVTLTAAQANQIVQLKLAAVPEAAIMNVPINVIGADQAVTAYDVQAASVAQYAQSLRTELMPASSSDLPKSLTEWCQKNSAQAVKLAFWAKYRFGNPALPRPGDRPAYRTAIGKVMLGLLVEAGAVDPNATLNSGLKALSSQWSTDGGVLSADSQATMPTDTALAAFLKTNFPISQGQQTEDSLGFLSDLMGLDYGEVYRATIFDPSFYAADGPEVAAWRANAYLLYQGQTALNELNSDLIAQDALVEHV